MNSHTAPKDIIYFSSEFFIEKQARTKANCKIFEVYFLFPLPYSFQSPKTLLLVIPFPFLRQERKQAFAGDCNILIIIHNGPGLCIHRIAEPLLWNDLLRSSALNHFPNRISSAYSRVMTGIFPVLFNTF